MLRKTHITLGVTAALLAARPDTMQGCISVSLAAACGSVISDIDADKSKARKEADIALSVSVMAFAAFIIAERISGMGLTARLMSSEGVSRKLLGAVSFIALCAFGKLKQHRTFMHSLLGGALLSACLGMLMERDIVVAFSAAFLSHLALDSLNHRPIYLFWPARIPVGLGICSSDGLLNRILSVVGALSAIILIDAYSGLRLFEALERIAGTRV